MAKKTTSKTRGPRAKPRARKKAVQLKFASPVNPESITSLSRLSDRKLLSLRLKDVARLLDVSIFSTETEALLDDLRSKGLDFLRPSFYLGDEWFSPEGLMVISIPFFLAHTRLRQLEQKMLGAVEGAKRDLFMKLLRHETGHCFDHAYQVSKTREWRRLFGTVPKQEYNPDVYTADIDSKDHVRHLGAYYAQAHPDEDFAETFAVWLDPNSNWRHEYRSWPRALAKLRYIDRIAKKFGQVEPRCESIWSKIGRASIMTTMMSRFYAQRRREVANARVTLVSSIATIISEAC